MNRGSQTAESDHAGAVAGFNEAPIHESGKCSVFRRNLAVYFGFNEAPIHESGKSTLDWVEATHGMASMRPRFMNRGSGLLPVNMVITMRASMRPRFMNRGSCSVQR